MIAAVAYNEIRLQPLPGSPPPTQSSPSCASSDLATNTSERQRGRLYENTRVYLAIEIELTSTMSYQINFRNALMLRPGCLKHHRCHRLANGHYDGLSEKAGWNRCHGLALSLAIATPSQIVKQLICDQPDVFNLGTVCSVPPPRCGPQIYVLRLSVRRVPPPPESRCVVTSFLSPCPRAPLDVANEPRSRLPIPSRSDPA